MANTHSAPIKSHINSLSFIVIPLLLVQFHRSHCSVRNQSMSCRYIRNSSRQRAVADRQLQCGRSRHILGIQSFWQLPVANTWFKLSFDFLQGKSCTCGKKLDLICWRHGKHITHRLEIVDQKQRSNATKICSDAWREGGTDFPLDQGPR